MTDTRSQEPSTSFAPAHVDEADLARAPERALPEQRYAIDAGPGGILMSTFSWWASDLKRLTFIGVLPLIITVAVGMAFATLVGGVLWAQDFGSTTGAGILGPIAVFFVLIGVAGVGYAAAAAGSVFAVDETARGEHSLGAWTCFVYGLGALKRLFGALLLGFGAYAMMVVLMGSVTAAVVEAARMIGVSSSVPLFVAQALWCAAFALLCMRLAPVIPIYVLEERGVIDGARRAWSLTRGRMKTIVGGGALVLAVSLFGGLFIAALAMIPVIGWLFGFAMMAIVPSLAHTFAFAIYASCLDDEA